MFESTENHEEFDVLAAHLEHYGWATLTPFLIPDFDLDERDFISACEDTQEQTTRPRSS